MSRPVNWLLILSALLSALTGTGASARVPQQAAAVVQRTSAAAATRATTPATVLFVSSPPSLVALATASARPLPVVGTAAPIYLARLRV